MNRRYEIKIYMTSKENDNNFQRGTERGSTVQNKSKQKQNQAEQLTIDYLHNSRLKLDTIKKKEKMTTNK